jgi:hypothetical protein
MEYRRQDLTPRCRSHGPYSPDCFSPPVDYAEEVVGAIACSDGLDQTNMTAAEFLKYWQRVRVESVYLGDRWARNRLMCVFWRLRPSVTYAGMSVTRLMKHQSLTILLRSYGKLDLGLDSIRLE